MANKRTVIDTGTSKCQGVMRLRPDSITAFSMDDYTGSEQLIITNFFCSHPVSSVLF